MMLYRIGKILDKIDMWFHRIKVGQIIAYHCRGYVKVRVESWWQGNQIIYYEGELLTLRKLKWRYKKKLYNQRVLVVSAEQNILVVQIWDEKPKLAKYIETKLKENNNEKEN